MSFTKEQRFSIAKSLGASRPEEENKAAYRQWAATVSGVFETLMPGWACGDWEDFFRAAKAAPSKEEYKRAVPKALSHPGGEWFAWNRLMAENEYTIPPEEPAKDADDIEKLALLERAKEALKHSGLGRHEIQLYYPAEVWPKWS